MVFKLFLGYLNLSAEAFFEAPAAGNTQGQTTSTTFFILPGGKRLLLYVRPGPGLDCFHTSPKLRQCPISRMPTDALSSLKFFTLPDALFLYKWFWRTSAIFSPTTFDFDFDYLGFGT